MNSIKKIFSVAALGLGTAVALYTGSGLLFDGWNTASQSGGVDLRIPAALVTAFAAAGAYAGYRSLMKLAQAQRLSDTDAELLRRYREHDPDFERAIKEFAESEASVRPQDDPAEGSVINSSKPSDKNNPKL